MRNKVLNQAKKKVANIRSQDLAIYFPIEVGDPNLWLTGEELEHILFQSLKGISLQGLPLRTRSKYLKEKVCEALGYKIPKSFKKVQPRFTGQNFDTYIQKSNNLQIWNEVLSSGKRYVLIKVSESDLITNVKVIHGQKLSDYDTTGALTQKYQARLKISVVKSILISKNDTKVIRKIAKKTNQKVNLKEYSPIDNPQVGYLLPIGTIYNKLLNLIGKKINHKGFDQERNRGSELHSLVCNALGYKNYRDDGKFPDIKHQLLEIKLQTSPTIDLGLICPNSEELLDIKSINNIRHCDTRYAIFYGNISGESIIIKNIMLTTGEDFFSYFKQFEGKRVNKKIQIPLPRNFFS